MAYPIKYFDSLQQGAPALTNAWGSMTALLDAVLVNGYNLKSLSTLTSASGVATATISAGHLFQVGQILLIAGAVESDYNGEIKVLSVTSTAFTFAVSTSAPATATGTITVKVAPLGWEIAFTGTNKRAYRSKNVLSNRPFLRVDDGLDPLYNTAYAKYAKVTMAQGMSDIDTFVGARAPYDSTLPTKNEVATGSGTTVVNGWYKWIYARNDAEYSSDTTAPGDFNRQWTIIGDDRGFYFFKTVGSTGAYYNASCFTDFKSFRSGDAFNTLLVANDLYQGANATMERGAELRQYFTKSLDYSGKICMRNHTQIGVNERLGFTSLNTNNGQTISGYSTGISFPNGADYSLLLHPTYLRQESSHMRGEMPGMMWIHNDGPTFNNGDLITGVAGYEGKTFRLIRVSYTPSTAVYVPTWLAFDMTGPWW